MLRQMVRHGARDALTAPLLVLGTGAIHSRRARWVLQMIFHSV